MSTERDEQQSIAVRPDAMSVNSLHSVADTVAVPPAMQIKSTINECLGQQGGQRCIALTHLGGPDARRTPTGGAVWRETLGRWRNVAPLKGRRVGGEASPVGVGSLMVHGWHAGTQHGFTGASNMAVLPGRSHGGKGGGGCSAVVQCAPTARPRFCQAWAGQEPGDSLL